MTTDFHYFKIYFIYLKDKITEKERYTERKRQILHLLVHSSNGQLGYTEARNQELLWNVPQSCLTIFHCFIRHISGN